MGHTAESILVASILPKRTQLNASIVNLLQSSLCEDLQEFMLENKKISQDAHRIWTLLVELFVNTKWDEIESEHEYEEVEEDSTFSTTYTEPQASISKESKKQKMQLLWRRGLTAPTVRSDRPHQKN
jgi:hypothetical protein